MDFVKPLWLSHTTVGAGGKQSGQESSIFTLDVGSGDRLATGGLDCTVRVWNTSAFNSFSNDSSVPPAIHSNGHNFQKPEKDENLYNFSQPEQAKSFNNLEDFEKIDISPPQVDETLKAVMARHNGAVLCARWAPLLTNGPFICNRQLLATGSDDSIILIWQRTPNTPGNLEAGGLQCSESYSVIHRLTGHASDVNGVEWSHDGRCVTVLV